jgi:putative ATP-dependent endonuclease of OLD family
LGAGRCRFAREHKRLCGYLFLHALRTGTRALGLQRGSLSDTVLRLPENGLSAMWQHTWKRLRGLDPAIGEIEQTKTNIRRAARRCHSS